MRVQDARSGTRASVSGLGSGRPPPTTWSRPATGLPEVLLTLLVQLSVFVSTETFQQHAGHDLPHDLPRDGRSVPVGRHKGEPCSSCVTGARGQPRRLHQKLYKYVQKYAGFLLKINGYGF